MKFPKIRAPAAFTLPAFTSSPPPPADAALPEMTVPPPIATEPVALLKITAAAYLVGEVVGDERIVHDNPAGAAEGQSAAG